MQDEQKVEIQEQPSAQHIEVPEEPDERADVPEARRVPSTRVMMCDWTG